MREVTLWPHGSWKFEEEAAVSEERYVVRDKDGALWGRNAYNQLTTGGYRGAIMYREFDRDGARCVASVARDLYPHFGPFKLYRLIPRAKPKAPREVFLYVGDDGVPEEFDTTREGVDYFVNQYGDGRVVRYVLAEGEK